MAKKSSLSFRTQFDRQAVISQPGERFQDTYNPIVTDTGSIDLEVSGKRDLYAYIQSHADSVDINLIVQRYASGDGNALNQRNSLYGDFTDFPKTYAEMQQRFIDAENLFMSLKPDDRAKYNYNVAEFIADIGSERWLEVLGLNPAKQDSGAEKLPPVKSDPLPVSDPVPVSDPISSGGDSNVKER